MTIRHRLNKENSFKILTILSYVFLLSFFSIQLYSEGICLRIFYPKDDIYITCLQVSIIERVLLLIIGMVNIMPYILLQKKNKAILSEKWTKFGLVLGLTAVVLAAITVSRTTLEAYLSNSNNYSFSILFPSNVQNRIIITSSGAIPEILMLFAILMSLDGTDNGTVSRLSFIFGLIGFLLIMRPFYIDSIYIVWLFLISFCKETKTIRINTVAFLTVYLLDTLLNISIFDILILDILRINGVYNLSGEVRGFLSIGLCTISLILTAINHDKTEPDYAAQMLLRGCNKEIIISGIVILLLVIYNIIFFVMEKFGTNEVSSFFEGSRVVDFMFSVLGIMVYLPKQDKNKFIFYRKIFPLLIPIWYSMRMNKFYYSEVYSRYYLDYKHAVEGGNALICSNTDSFFFICVAIVLYSIFALYEYGVKEKPMMVIFAVAFVIGLLYLPDIILINQSKPITSATIANIVITMISPALMVTQGFMNSRQDRVHNTGPYR